MEPFTKQDVATSSQFRFLVGPDRKEFTIHSALAASLSAQLRVLVTGDSFKESSEGFVVWEDVDVTVFTSFWEYAYTDDYVTPRALERSIPYVPSTGSTNDKETSKNKEKRGRIKPISNSVTQNGKIQKKLPKQEQIKDKFRTFWNKALLDLAMTRELDTQNKPQSPAMEFRYIIPLHHAKVYIFANRYGLLGLEVRSLRKLVNFLEWPTLFGFAIRDMIPLICFCWNEPVPHPLKKMTVQFAACHVENLCKFDTFKELLENAEGFASQLIYCMLERLDKDEEKTS